MREVRHAASQKLNVKERGCEERERKLSKCSLTFDGGGLLLSFTCLTSLSLSPLHPSPRRPLYITTVALHRQEDGRELRALPAVHVTRIGDLGGQQQSRKERRRHRRRCRCRSSCFDPSGFGSRRRCRANGDPGQEGAQEAKKARP